MEPLHHEAVTHLLTQLSPLLFLRGDLVLYVFVPLEVAQSPKYVCPKYVCPFSAGLGHDCSVNILVC